MYKENKNSSLESMRRFGKRRPIADQITIYVKTMFSTFA